MAFNIVKSLLITLVISLIISGICYAMGLGFTKPLVITIITLFVGGFLIGQISETLLAINNKRLENERIKEFSKQGMIIECAYCEEMNFVPIRLDERNEFVCEKCNEKNAVQISVAASRITTPIDSIKAEIKNG